MPKADPVAKIVKKIEALQSKAEKIVGDLAELNQLVASLQAAKEEPAPVAAPAKRGRKPKAEAAAEAAADAVVDEAPKRRGRPKAAKPAEAEPTVVGEGASAPKKRGRKPKAV